MLFRRVSGVLLMLLGTMGVLACAIAIYETRAAEKYCFQFAGRAFDSAEGVLEDIHARLTEIDLSVTQVRSRLKNAISRADELQRDGSGNKVLADYISRALDQEVGEKMAKARALVDSAVSSVVAISHLINLVEETDLVPEETFGRDGALMKRVGRASNTLRRLTGLLEQTRQTARGLQQNPHSERDLLKLNREVGEMDQGLAEVQTLGSDFKGAAQKIQIHLLHCQDQTNRWIQLGGILIPLLLVWLGAGQTALIILGGRLCVRK